MKKIVEDLKRDDLVESTHSNGASPPLIVPKKEVASRVRDKKKGKRRTGNVSSSRPKKYFVLSSRPERNGNVSSLKI